MFRKLPIFIFSIVFLGILILGFVKTVAAQSADVSTSPTPELIQEIQQSFPGLPIDIPGLGNPSGGTGGLPIGSGPVAEGTWVSDSNVTFVGKTASRSGDFLDWTLRNYDWACATKNSNGTCTNQGNPLVGFWALIRNIVYALLIAVVLVAAFVMIITRGRSITVMRFIPRFIFILVLVTLSYSLIQFIYQITDIITGFFLRVGGQLISTRDLIFIGFNYQTFEGLRLAGAKYDESAFITLLLVRLTAITYYVMTGILLIRKIILWFFIVLSPVFPLLLFFRPVRNTGKIWIGEFFRWLLYAPLFAIFLHGLVVLWSSGSPEKPGIPLAFDLTSPGRIPGIEENVVYPTAVNILIGGPGQQIGQFNSVNLQDTFALYVVSLLMLWVVILLPFILLKIFLDYLTNISFKDNATFQKIWDRGMAPFNPKPPAPATPPIIPPPATTGLAKSLPFAAGISRTLNQTKNVTENKTVNQVMANPVNTQILQLSNLSIPKMRDIAKFETSMISKDTIRQHEVNRLKTSLSRIANPSSVQSASERDRYMQVKHQLTQEKQKGNVLASSILSAANTTTKSTQAHIPGQIHTVANLPTVNKVQQVSLEDYEEVRKMWVETYQSSEPPTDLTGKQSNREEWIKTDIDKINQAITLLSSIDPSRSQEGMDMVSNILPFLMVGGFSKTEVIAYLKAKLEAAKQVMSDTNKKKEDEESMVEKGATTTTAEKHMTLEAEAKIPEESNEVREKLDVPENGQGKIDELRKTGGGI